MGTVYKKTITRPLPAGAEVSMRDKERWAKWTDGKGRSRSARMTDAGRITVESGTYIAQYRDGQGIVREMSTGCRDKGAANSILTRLERESELVRAGVMTVPEHAAAGHAHASLDSHIDAFILHMVAKGTVDHHRKKTKAYLMKMNEACRFSKLPHLRRDVFERWLDSQTFSARVRNGYRVAAVSFGNWLLRGQRMTLNPFAGIPRANEKLDVRRQRRALTEAELGKLFQHAKARPLADRVKNRGTDAKLKPATRRSLALLGLERATAYKLMALTGLRCNEVATLTLGALVLEGDTPHIALEGRNAKNRKGANVALRGDIAVDLSDYLDARLAWLRSGQNGPIPMHILSTARVFENMPSLRVFDKDLAAAGIEKVDERGRTLDMHSLRHTFATLLGRSGASLQVAQTAMRHSDPKLTSTTYTHLELVDVGRALDALPRLPMNGQGLVAVNVAVTSGKRGNSESIPGNSTGTPLSIEAESGERRIANVYNVIRELSPADDEGKDGGPCRSRTCDLVIKSHLLYQLS